MALFSIGGRSVGVTVANMHNFISPLTGITDVFSDLALKLIYFAFFM